MPPDTFQPLKVSDAAKGSSAFTALEFLTQPTSIEPLPNGELAVIGAAGAWFVARGEDANHAPATPMTAS